MNEASLHTRRISVVLSRCTGDWSHFISLTCWNVIRYRREYYSDVERIIEYVLLITHNGQDIILNKDSRTHLIQLLNNEEILDLADRVEHPELMNPSFC